jgi:hypothetical protein
MLGSRSIYSKTVGSRYSLSKKAGRPHSFTPLSYKLLFSNALGAGGATVMENALPGVKCVSRLDLSGKKFSFYFMNIPFLNSRDQIDHVERTQVATIPDRDLVAT